MTLPGLEYWWLVPAAVVLDMALGDPPLPWRHPVCWIGGFLQALEGPARRLGASRLVGSVCAALTVGLTGAAVHGLINLPWIGAAAGLYLAYAGLAAESLARTGEQVLEKLENAPLPEAQQALSMLVSRDTSVQDRQTLRKSLADTLAENLTDAVAAPLFWLLIGGPTGLWMYKAVSTMDSMWGYKTPQWLRLGWAGARMDDAAAWLPARLAALLLGLTDRWTRLSAAFGGRWPGMGVIARQAGGMESPNSGWPMAAGAWLLGARMGGPTLYFGTMVHKPWVGPPEHDARPWDARRLAALCRAVRVMSLTIFVFLYAAAWTAQAALWRWL